MPKDSSAPPLRLIDCEGTVAGAGVVCLDEAAGRRRELQALKAEARDFEARNGKNLYSDFILKHGCRPDPEHAATFGRLINKRVRASDGTLQPRLTRAERSQQKAERVRRKIQAARSEQIDGLICAIRYLSKISIDPVELIAHLSPQFDRPIIREKLSTAVESLNRIAEEWQYHEQGTVD